MPPTTPRASAGASLEWKLPALIVALIAAVVLSFAWLSWREVRDSAVALAQERLLGAARQLRTLSMRNTQLRVQGQRTLAADTHVVRALRGGDTALAAARMARLAGAQDTALVAWELRLPDGAPRLRVDGASRRTAAGGAGGDAGRFPVTTVPERAEDVALRDAMRDADDDDADSARASVPFVVGEDVHIWSVVPVRDDAGLAGFVAERRRITNSSSTVASLRGLIGGEAEVHFGRIEGFWVRPDGRPTPPALDLADLDSSFVATTRDGRHVVGAQAPLAGTPWTFVVLRPAYVVLAQSRRFLNWMAIAGTVVVLLAAVAALVLSRRVTRPLRALTQAAEAVAGGDFSQRVALARNDELGRLGTAFDAMAGRIGRLQGATAALAGAAELSEVAGVIVREGAGAAGAPAGALFLVAADDGSLELARAQGYAPGSFSPSMRVPLDGSYPVGIAARERRAVYVPTLAAWRERFGDARLPQEHRAWAALPLVARGRTLGVLGLSYDDEQRFDAERRAFLESFAQQCAQALERALLFDAAVRARVAAEEAGRAASAANRAKSEFLAMMSHELRTPLNAIGGYVDLLELGLRGPLTEAQRADLARVRGSQQHLLTIINDLLGFARLEAGQLELQAMDVPVATLFEEVEALLVPLATARDVRLVVVPPPPGLRACADPEKLRQVVLNVASNGVRFTEPGGEVRLSGAHAENGVVLRVEDTGIGIAGDQLERIFEPFVQVDAGLTRRSGGTGLGLAISRDLARAMGGRIDVTSDPGRGSTFTIVVPHASPTARPAAVEHTGRAVD